MDIEKVEIGDASILQGDCLETLKTLPAELVQCCVTSPPYFGLRDYGHDGQVGLETTPEEYVGKMVDVFREVWRVLRGDGTLWLNLGDSYAANRSYQVNSTKGGAKHGPGQSVGGKGSIVPDGLKPKDLIGIPWRVAFALQADGWYLRSDIIWSKPNPMPESVTDRPTKAHEYLFLLTKAERYFYDAEAVKEKSDKGHNGSSFDVGKTMSAREHLAPVGTQPRTETGYRNKRTVWNVSTQPYPGAHFAVFPPKLIEPCILAGSKSGDTILDPFNGSGTTGIVALKNRRNYIGCELNPEYVKLSVPRLKAEQAQMQFAL